MRVMLAHGAQQRRFARLLAAAGHEVIEAAGDADVLARCRAAAPDVVVLDRLELVAAIKADRDAYPTAIIMTAPAGLGVAAAEASLSGGVQDFLVEPVSDGELLARVAAAARTKDLQQELVAQARRLEARVREDPLTGLANRRFILTQLAGMVSGTRRHGRPLSIALIDVDRFKAVNDVHGHDVGDRVLTAAVRTMREHLRGEDQLGRLGGDEFLVLLPDTGPEAAASVAEKLRHEVAATRAGVPITISVGVATWEDEAPESLMRRGDEALYAAKRAGRDRVRTALPATLLRRT